MYHATLRWCADESRHLPSRRSDTDVQRQFASMLTSTSEKNNFGCLATQFQHWNYVCRRHPLLLSNIYVVWPPPHLYIFNSDGNEAWDGHAAFQMHINYSRRRSSRQPIANCKFPPAFVVTCIIHTKFNVSGQWTFHFWPSRARWPQCKISKIAAEIRFLRNPTTAFKKLWKKVFPYLKSDSQKFRESSWRISWPAAINLRLRPCPKTTERDIIGTKWTEIILHLALYSLSHSENV